MRRIPWDVLLALLAGLGAGLLYSWVISPVRVVDSAPIALRADFKDQYRSAIAAAFASTGNLERARARLGLLGDANSIEALNAQAQRMLASGDIQQADQLAALASILAQGNAFVAPPASSTPNPPPTGGAVSTGSEAVSTSTSVNIVTATSEETPTQSIILEATPRPTRTPLPTQGEPFVLTGQESICDSNLPDGLLQVLVLNANRRQLPGIEIRITWDNGEDQFFTGLKPELGNGYADFIMSPDITYAVQLALGSDIATSLIAPVCESPSGEPFTGGYKLTFQQP